MKIFILVKIFILMKMFISMKIFIKKFVKSIINNGLLVTLAMIFIDRAELE